MLGAVCISPRRTVVIAAFVVVCAFAGGLAGWCSSAQASIYWPESFTGLLPQGSTAPGIRAASNDGG